MVIFSINSMVAVYQLCRLVIREYAEMWPPSLVTIDVAVNWTLNEAIESILVAVQSLMLNHLATTCAGASLLLRISLWKFASDSMM